MQTLSVTALNTQIKSLLETTFMQIQVVGEISNLVVHSSGHIYFSIKDENSTISCVMFKGNARYLKFQLENGQKVQVSANITVFVPRGNYQLLCTKIEPDGVGSLALAFEQLKIKLQAKGYFEQSIKKSLPKFPKKIAIVTSPTGAAIEDMKKVAANRWNLCELILIPTLVQGNGSEEDISRSIKFADSLNVDIIVVGRGGGSIEDLWAFNSEIVADAIFEAKTPIISAVGHEIDFLISDFVADIRAATPSNAIEIALPNKNDQLLAIDLYMQDLERSIKNIFQKKEDELINIKKIFSLNSIDSKINFIQNQIELIKDNFNRVILQKYQIFQNILDSLKQNYELNNPSKKDQTSFVQISKNNILIDLEKLEIDDTIELQTAKVKAIAKIISLSKQQV
ncbi:Exodeoxyribonuclease 7 large subunit [Aliarcobacter thereius]|uniref:Exodeoxyribonuclease 7 large subunit n=2 Tax=Aliarcobacter thereius TaxID=544718 RepID=A0A1C0B810_9BACT|nr:exodeoxyribonuclease VII large subunit [Aliarcobacter thereius]OCL87743.1 Exodeoxyribonuclease 7 large subunit [Aliarcobacter thereius]OCL95394.1 Exodeoxyribonuclease 7 large subunit [Aliarcobacter thereius LMG 24486]OCL99713.1 Exodeoxyribonuclease 7 large subunit [Aliarcobacter thereius]QBF16618.1 exodeoxyribonuclease VII, large subunit [Aliarcobacter thereius LMG 24486]TLS93658.1 exodeoxyribonuclease VII large subunit [Aliarcobacter thereius]